MPTISVPICDHLYSVKIESGIAGNAGAEIRGLQGVAGDCVVVTDSNVGPIWGEAVEDSLRKAGFGVTGIVVPAGEGSKSFAALEAILLQMTAAGLDRRSLLVALGGGVIGDLAGFAASVFYRGIRWVQIPTTVVSLVDSSVGGKTGINNSYGKNLIGTFHQPSLVLADPEVLETLPDREYREGFAEVIKHAAIRDPAMFPAIHAAANRPSAILEDLIARNVAIKADIVTQDEFESKGLRALLNFGHTIGHAIEAAAGYGELFHGEAVSLGLRAALFLSRRLRGLKEEEEVMVLNALAAFQLPLVLPDSLSTPMILEKLSRDKKFVSGAIRFVLIPELGAAEVSAGVTRADLEEATEHLRTPVKNLA